MFVTKAKHEAALAEKDATIEGLMRRLETAQAREAILVTKCQTALARLAPFTNHMRDKGGRFVKKGME